MDRRQDQRLLRVLIDGIDFRGDAHPLMTGFSKPDFHGFETPAEAEDYMDGKGVMLYNYDIKYGAGKRIRSMVRLRTTQSRMVVDQEFSHTIRKFPNPANSQLF